MTDLDLLTGTIASRLRLLPDVTRLYPTRTGLDALVHSVHGLLDAVADDPTVVLRPTDGAYVIETNVGLTGDVPAQQAAAALHTAIRDTCAQHDVPVHHIRIRISSID